MNEVLEELLYGLGSDVACLAGVGEDFSVLALAVDNFDCLRLRRPAMLYYLPASLPCCTGLTSVRAENWLLVASALGVTYLFAVTLAMLNEHFDSSLPEMIETEVDSQHTRYIPLPVRVATVQDAQGRSYRVDVLAALAFSLNKGDSLSIVKKRGLIGKPWLQDKERYDSLQSSRRVRGIVWSAVSALLALLWLVVFIRLRAVWLGIGALITSFLVAFGLFLYLI